MRVRAGNLVQMRDGRVVYVTDAFDEDVEAWENEGGLPNDNIFRGYLCERSVSYIDGYLETSTVVVSDMSEVTSIIDDSVLP